ncbi:putative reverse transcriptase domain-containing protein [Tanacetum coccineum]
MKMEILLEPTSNKLLVGSFKDGDGDGDTHYERSHKGVKASANSDIVYFFTSAQDGDPLQDDVRLCLGDDLKKAQDHNQRQVKDESKDHYPKCTRYQMKNQIPHKGVKASANSDVMYFFTSAQDGNPSQDDIRIWLGDDLKKAQDHRYLKDGNGDGNSQFLRCQHLLSYHDDSSDEDLVVNSRANFVYPGGNDAGPSIEERAILFLEAQDWVDLCLSRWSLHYTVGIKARLPVNASKRNRPLNYAYEHNLSSVFMERLGGAIRSVLGEDDVVMRENFIPHNYQRLMYQRLQNLKQGTKSVEDYTTKFYQLIARNDIQETDDQLVSRYIGGLRVQIMDSVNMFDPVTLSDAYQRAFALLKITRKRGWKLRLFCHKGELFCWVRNGKIMVVADDDYEEPPVLDDDQYKEEIVSGDVGVNLMVRYSCLTPKVAGDDWFKHIIFQSTCTILGKVCTFVVDSGSCDNLISEEAVQKLGLKTENRPKPYKLQWLKKGGDVTVSKRVLVAFSVGTTYKDNVWCDVVPMDACHLLLGRPWEYDRNTTHNGRANTYSFLFDGVTITLMPNKPKVLVNKPTGTLLTLSQFQDELEMGGDVFVLIGKEVAKDSKIPEAMIPLLEEFSDVFPDELPD